MEFGFVGSIPLIEMTVLTYSGTDPNTLAAVASFNSYFSLTFEFGVLAFMFTMITSILARS